MGEFDPCYNHEEPNFILGFIKYTINDVYKIAKKRGHKKCVKYICEKII